MSPRDPAVCASYHYAEPVLVFRAGKTFLSGLIAARALQPDFPGGCDGDRTQSKSPNLLRARQRGAPSFRPARKSASDSTRFQVSARSNQTARETGDALRDECAA